MITYVLWHDGIYLGTIVQEGHTTFHIYPHFSYIFDPVPLLKGVQIQERSLWSGFYALGASVWRLFAVLVIVRGVQAPFIIAIPSFPFNCFLSLEVFTSRQFQMKMFWATTMVAAFLVCLGVFHCPCQLNHELLSHPLDSTGVITLWVLTITSILFF